VWDADGKVLPSWFELAEGGARHSVRAAGLEDERRATPSLSQKVFHTGRISGCER
jgi:hypothetical protein